eukprot:3934386-Rhodomonas_salina.1
MVLGRYEFVFGLLEFGLCLLENSVKVFDILDIVVSTRSRALDTQVPGACRKLCCGQHAGPAARSHLKYENCCELFSLSLLNNISSAAAKVAIGRWD